MKTKTAAVLTVFDAANMTDKGRRDIIKWIERQAVMLKHYHKKLSKRWTARYLYMPK